MHRLVLLLPLRHGLLPVVIVGRGRGHSLADDVVGAAAAAAVAVVWVLRVLLLLLVVQLLLLLLICGGAGNGLDVELAVQPGANVIQGEAVVVNAVSMS